MEVKEIRFGEVGWDKKINWDEELKKRIKCLEEIGDDRLREDIDKAWLLYKKGDYETLKKLLPKIRHNRRDSVIEDLKEIVKNEVPSEYHEIYDRLGFYTRHPGSERLITGACNLLQKAIDEGKWKPTSEGKKLFDELGQWGG